MASAETIKKELSLLHVTLLTTGKLLMGIGIGIGIASHIFYAQPYWYVFILLGALVLLPVLYHILKAEAMTEEKLIRKVAQKKAKKKKRR